MTRRRGVRLLVHRSRLLLSAWRLHRAAQALARGATLNETRIGMLATPRLPENVAARDAVWAAAWAARIGRRAGRRLDTCLLRALVAGTLVAGPGVAVRVGVHRPVPEADLLDAHAWLTVDGREVSLTEAQSDARFEEVLALPMERPT